MFLPMMHLLMLLMHNKVNQPGILFASAHNIKKGVNYNIDVLS